MIFPAQFLNSFFRHNDASFSHHFTSDVFGLPLTPLFHARPFSPKTSLQHFRTLLYHIQQIPVPPLQRCADAPPVAAILPAVCREGYGRNIPDPFCTVLLLGWKRKRGRSKRLVRPQHGRASKAWRVLFYSQLRSFHRQTENATKK